MQEVKLPEWERLTAPFDPEDHEWLQKADYGDTVIMVPYIRKPAILARLQEVFGISGFSLQVDTPTVQTVTTFQKGKPVEKMIAYTRATLTIKKYGTAYSDIGASTIGYDPETAIKGAATDATKRVAKLIGIGLYLDRGGDLSVRVPAIDGKPKWYPLLVIHDGTPMAIDPDPTFRAGNNKGRRISEVDQKTLEAALDWFDKHPDAKQQQLPFYLALAHKLGRL